MGLVQSVWRRMFESFAAVQAILGQSHLSTSPRVDMAVKTFISWWRLDEWPEPIRYDDKLCAT